MSTRDARAQAHAGSDPGAQPAARVADAAASTSRTARILYLEDITVSFDGFKALNELSLDIDAGELRCIIGPNGAGKTTMMDVITGKTRPDAGTAFFGQTIDLTRLTRAEIAHAGIGRKFQKPTVFEQHTVFENLELALKADKRVRADAVRAARLARSATASATMLDADPPRPDSAARLAGLLSHGQKQWLEIGMLLMQDRKLLLLDEPVAGMTDEETERTAELFLVARRRALADRGRARHGFRRAHRATASPCCTRAACSPKGRWSRCRTTSA